MEDCDYERRLEDDRQRAGKELSKNMKELRHLSKHIKTALDAIDAVFDDERKKTTSNRQLQQMIEQKGIKHDNIYFHPENTLYLIRKFLAADELVDNYKQRKPQDESSLYDYKEKSTDEYNPQKNVNEGAYPPQQSHTRESGPYDYVNRPQDDYNSPSFHHELQNENKDANNNIGNNIAAMYDEHYNRPGVKSDSASGIHKNPVDKGTSNVYPDNWMPSTPDTAETLDQKMASDCKITKSDAKSSGGYNWNEKMQKKATNRYYKMPIKDKADLIKIRELGEGQATTKAATELFEREAGMNKNQLEADSSSFFLTEICQLKSISLI
ncbi:Oidioi.mRNA.OKI2018_I69.chr1.g2435.t1.cds [Oikopleura dioica]|uniref:Oidioi.mRNA.OKI2018_I69.chr1.g2435.t1.cds n=1 Tax=Oikopleura dioica TaxID=34765 RepID=A0ABN7SVB2_OIKDI|nr:Oidioi.mRNA.OKI2018_I69.chr1.g2435.t1.cds [Oikopleura dioica]